MSAEKKAGFVVTVTDAKVLGAPFVNQIETEKYQGLLVNINLEGGFTLSAFEGAEYFELYTKLKAGDRITFITDGIGQPRYGKSKTSAEGTQTGGGTIVANLPPIHNGSLNVVDILDIKEPEHVTRFEELLSKREAAKPRAAAAGRPGFNSARDEIEGFKEGETGTGTSTTTTEDEGLKDM